MGKLDRLIRICAIGLVGLTAHLSGREALKQECSECVQAYGQALYWKWTGARTEFAAETGTVVGPNLQRQTTHDFNPDYQWGYRVGLRWQPNHGCAYVDLSYLQFSKTQEAQAFGFPVGFGPFLSFLGNTFGLCTLNMNTEYQNVDLTVGAYLYHCGPLALQVYTGGRWVYLKESATLDGPNNPGPGHLEGHSKYNAGAVKVGLGADCRCFCLNAFGAIDFLTVIGTESSNEFFQDPEDLFIRPEKDSFQVTTGLGLRLGVRCDRRFCCVRFTGEIGYEIQNYFDVLRATLRSSDFANDISDADGGFAGPYVSLRVGY